MTWIEKCFSLFKITFLKMGDRFSGGIGRNASIITHVQAAGTRYLPYFSNTFEKLTLEGRFLSQVQIWNSGEKFQDLRTRGIWVQVIRSRSDYFQCSFCYKITILLSLKTTIRIKLIQEKYNIKKTLLEWQKLGHWRKFFRKVKNILVLG